MSEEQVDNTNVSNESEEVAERSEAHTEKEALSPVNTLETLTNEIIKLRNKYDEEIKSLTEQNIKLSTQLKEQDNLIGNYKEQLFNESIPYEKLQNIEKLNMEKEYTDAFTSVYNRLKHRLTEGNNNKQAFVNRCMEAFDGRV